MLLKIISLFYIVCTCIYTVNFGRWAWKRQNKSGAVGIFILAIITLLLPNYLLFLK